MQVEATSERCFGGISVVIPALNEEASIAPLVEALIIELPEAEILVVDDGSNDRTAERASKRGPGSFSILTRKVTAPQSSQAPELQTAPYWCSWMRMVSIARVT